MSLNKLTIFSRPYLSKAWDAYPYALEGTFESLQYAISLDETNPHTLVMLGRLYYEQLHDYEEAIHYFEQAMAIDMKNNIVLSHLTKVYILNEDYDKAKKLIDYGINLKGIDKATLLFRRAWLLECLGKYKKAKKTLIKLKATLCHNEYDSLVEKNQNRLKQKIEINKDKKKKMSKRKKSN